MLLHLSHSPLVQFLDVTGENAYLGTRFDLTAGGFPACFSENRSKARRCLIFGHMAKLADLPAVRTLAAMG